MWIQKPASSNLIKPFTWYGSSNLAYYPVKTPYQSSNWIQKYLGKAQCCSVRIIIVKNQQTMGKGNNSFHSWHQWVSCWFGKVRVEFINGLSCQILSHLVIAVKRSFWMPSVHSTLPSKHVLMFFGTNLSSISIHLYIHIKENLRKFLNLILHVLKAIGHLGMQARSLKIDFFM